ncbi:MAG: AAA family ATPase [Dehalococcoidia bacterium]
MVPAKLSMRNFLCYRDNVPPLDFSGIHVACLSGDNGHGKSAILDAITWALWGKARARTDDELVHLGQTEAEVDFEFVVDGARYRVIRKRKKGGDRGRGESMLDFFVEGTNGWRPISGNTLRETERHIEETLHMDYETFINSAFLMQGRADEFVRKTAAQRKEVLASILGLEQYDRLAERCKELAKEAELRSRQLEAAIRSIDEQLARRGEYEQQLDEVRAELARTEEEAAAQEGLVDTLRRAAEALGYQRQQLRRAEEQWQRTEDELERHRRQVAEHRKCIEWYQATVRQAEEIRRGHERLQEARAREAELGRLHSALMGLRVEEERLQGQIERARQELANEARNRGSRIEELAASAAALTAWREEKEAVKAELAALASREEELAAMGQEERQAAAEAEALRAANRQLEADIRELRRRTEELATAGARCPLCGTDLGEEQMQHICRQYGLEEEDKEHGLRENEERAADLSRQAEELRRRIAGLEGEVRRRRSELDQRLAVLARQIEQGEAAEKELPRLRAELAALEERIAREDYAREERRRLQEVRREMVALAYDPQAHTEARRQVEELAGFEERFRQLGQAEKLLEREQQALAAAEENRDRWQERWEEARQEVERLRAEVAEQPDVEPQLGEARQRLEGLRANERRQRQALGALEQEIERCRALEEERRPKLEALNQAGSEKAIYDELAVAFGKNGVQALIIDAALPEITDEANRLLSQMTNGRMSLAMRTQRETQRGTVMETLDIRIADELGTRSYEMYSGGEAFRINFALRIALSRLLARRAGAPLPTLVIDEGFGTQDSAGRERLVEAIRAIQDDFRCLLVITHIDELRDAFPVRIEVTKTAEGSSIAVV